MARRSFIDVVVVATAVVGSVVVVVVAAAVIVISVPWKELVDILDIRFFLQNRGTIWKKVEP